MPSGHAVDKTLSSFLKKLADEQKLPASVISSLSSLVQQSLLTDQQAVEEALSQDLEQSDGRD